MHKVNIEIFCIAQTRMNAEETRRWLDRCGASDTKVPRTQPRCEVCHPEYCEHPPTEPEVTDAGAVCGLCAKRCYMSFEPGLNPNVTRVRRKWHEYLTNILKSGHGSVTEHASWTFAIEGVSRVLTGELNRHRAGVAISEGSMRYIRFDDIGFWMPTSLEEGNQALMPTRKCTVCKGNGKIPAEMPTRDCCDWCLGSGRRNILGDEYFERIKRTTRNIFTDAFIEMEAINRRLCALWGIEEMKSFDTKKKLTSLFRRLIGMGVATGGTWTFNTRALRHIVALRTSPHAEEEIAHVIGLIGKHMFDTEPSLFGDFVCEDGVWIPENVKV